MHEARNLASQGQVASLRLEVPNLLHRVIHLEQLVFADIHEGHASLAIRTELRIVLRGRSPPESKKLFPTPATRQMRTRVGIRIGSGGLGRARMWTTQAGRGARAFGGLARRAIYWLCSAGAEISTEVGEKASPCRPMKPVTTGVTTPVFRLTNPTSFTMLAAV